MTQFFAKKLNKKGFTLAELLIVIAIIAVLVAIALPIFTGNLEKARYAVHQSNGRSLKSMAVAEILTNNELLASKTIKDTSHWTVKGSYVFSTEKFTITSIVYDDAAAGTPSIKACDEEDGSYVPFDGKSTSVSTIGKYNTAGSTPIYYEIVIVGQEIASYTTTA